MWYRYFAGKGVKVIQTTLSLFLEKFVNHTQKPSSPSSSPHIYTQLTQLSHPHLHPARPDLPTSSLSSQVTQLFPAHLQPAHPALPPSSLSPQLTQLTQTHLHPALPDLPHTFNPSSSSHIYTQISQLSQLSQPLPPPQLTQLSALPPPFTPSLPSSSPHIYTQLTQLSDCPGTFSPSSPTHIYIQLTQLFPISSLSSCLKFTPGCTLHNVLRHRQICDLAALASSKILISNGVVNPTPLTRTIL
ncbi:hypothetical protein PGT21_014138 [Puccinia graminis f. sp. tritici]|uniref:Uncharacterized protein n=1 Tax=Puccinia graminis f. sp. tritici TaxID=56615 RepID=A0A5B0LYR0_PUCGR|nr:hypothetical protein PGT21_014138 [Puccinia graminis f. sp. tritici]